jgi:hypothetical protein
MRLECYCAFPYNSPSFSQAPGGAFPGHVFYPFYGGVGEVDVLWFGGAVVPDFLPVGSIPYFGLDEAEGFADLGFCHAGEDYAQLHGELFFLVCGEALLLRGVGGSGVGNPAI